VLIRRAWKTELDPTEQQRALLRRAAGVARFVWNWGLAERVKLYREKGESTSAFSQLKDLRARKATEFPWLGEVSKCVPQYALRHLEAAFAHFFRRVKERKAGKGRGPIGFPRFKARGRCRAAFTVEGESVRVEAVRIRLPRIGRVRLKERGYLPAEGPDCHLLGVTVSECAGRWFVAVQGEVEQEVTPATGAAVGVDLGVTALATCSDGRTFDNPRALRSAERRLARAQRAMARCQKGSRRRERAKARVARVYYQVGNLRRDALHKASAAIVGRGRVAEERPAAIGVESLNVKGMMANHHLARAIADASMGELRRLLGYKAEWCGSEVVEAATFYPSSKTCSRCGAVRAELDLGERVFRCEVCGLVLGRDLNAATNLRNVAAESAETENAHGVAGSPALAGGPR